MERKIGETFEYQGKTYKVIESLRNICDNCAFSGECDATETVVGSCSCTSRLDDKNVIFKEIKDNKLTISIPEGMEIDAESSDLDTGVIKFRKKELTYKDIQDSVGKYPTSTFVTPRNRLKINAIDMLMNIAKYYNGDWKPDWSDIKEDKYHILCRGNNYYDIGCNANVRNNVIYFKNEEDAKTVIDNPDFRDILDAIFKN